MDNYFCIAVLRRRGYTIEQRWCISLKTEKKISQGRWRAYGLEFEHGNSWHIMPPTGWRTSGFRGGGPIALHWIKIRCCPGIHQARKDLRWSGTELTHLFNAESNSAITSWSENRSESTGLSGFLTEYCWSIISTRYDTCAIEVHWPECEERAPRSVEASTRNWNMQR